MLPGDLVFYAYNTADPATIHHVGIYIGAGNMIDAPYTGANVRITPFLRGDFIGAVRPPPPPPRRPRGRGPRPRPSPADRLTVAAGDDHGAWWPPAGRRGRPRRSAPAGEVVAVAVGGEGGPRPGRPRRRGSGRGRRCRGPRRSGSRARRRTELTALASIASRNVPRCSGLTLADTINTYMVPPSSPVRSGDLVHARGQLAQGAHLEHAVAGCTIGAHDRVGRVPLGPWFRVEPVEAAGPLGQVRNGSRPGSR